MTLTSEERELVERFSGEYVRAQSPVMLDLERAVCGCDYGGTSWTTREEAENIGRLLLLEKGRRLLEIGSGSGWPALYLAAITGCDATLTDVPGEALRLASERAARDALDDRTRFAVASGAALPFGPESFDAVSHSDVLCCLPHKRETLDECRRVAREGATMVFTVISIAPGLDAASHSIAVDSGPPFVESECGYPELLDRFGWSIDARVDVTPDYEETGKRHFRALQAREDGIRALLGDDAFDDLLARRRRNIEAVERRILRRELYAARRRRAS